MSDKIAVIGSNSFSGSSFIKHCLLEGLEVIGFSRSEELHECFLPYKWLPDESQSRFVFKRADINHDLELLMGALGAFRPDYVVNFAAQGMVAQSWQSPQDWYETNVVGNVKLHDQLRKCEWLRKYVHVSTPEVYGSTNGLIDENTSFNPSTPYAASRAACDLHLRTFLNQYKFPVVWTRAANVYGPGQQLYRIIPRTILSIKLGEKLKLHGGGHSVRSFINIADVADASLRVARGAEIGETFHLSTPRNISIRQLVESICRTMDADFNKVVEETEDRPGKDAAYLLNSAKARVELKWSDTVTLEQGIAETIEWVEANFEQLSRLPVDYVHKK
jgi:dTDP-glucose 4,6-dehydratase